ncbi:nuclear transport factor 2 family protein [Phyllobacteriaceae bacterium JZ32]
MSIFRLNGNLFPAARVLLIASAFVAATTVARADRADMSARNEAIVRQAFESWRVGGNVFAELLAPDVKWTIHGSGPVARTYTGIDDFVANASAPLISRLATPLVPKVKGIWAAGDTVIIRFDGAATTTSGAPYTNAFVWIFRMTDGRVTVAEAFLDLAAYQEVVDNNPPRAD